jgi:hypothetical protein
LAEATRHAVAVGYFSVARRSDASVPSAEPVWLVAPPAGRPSRRTVAGPVSIVGGSQSGRQTRSEAILDAAIRIAKNTGIGWPHLRLWPYARPKEIGDRSRVLSKLYHKFFPTAVLSGALHQPFVPPTPHPIRADRLARALAARSRAPEGWTWRLGNDRKRRLPGTFRTPLPIGKGVWTGSRIVLCVRPTNLSLRLAC